VPARPEACNNPDGLAGESKLDALEARLAALHARTREGFAERAAELRDAATRLQGGEADARDAIRRLAHKLRGVAGTAGHAELGERAGRLEQAALSGAADFAIAEGARRLAKAADVARATLPPPPASKSAPTTVEDRALGWRVVALDDEASTRRLLEIALKHAGCEATVHDDPEAAMRAVSDDAPDLVIVDAMMPDVDGLTFYRGVRARGPEIPVVILSAASHEELGWSLPDDPRLTWMRKPFRPGALLDELRAFVATTTG